MRRKTRFGLDCMHLLLTPWSTPLKWSLRFNTPGDGGAGAGGTENGGGGAGGDPKEKETPPPALSEEAKLQLIAERDGAKAVNRAITEALGLKVTWKDEGGKKTPVIEGLDDLKTLRTQAETNREDAQKKAGKWDERKQELETQFNERLNATKTGLEKKLGGLTKWVEKNQVVDPLRAALLAEGAVDPDGKGTFDDYLANLRTGLRVKVEIDEESGNADVQVQPVDAEGKPLTDGKGTVLSVRQYVAKWLEARPAFKSASVRRGPGAGGYGHGAAPAAGQAAGAKVGGDAAADWMFGAKG